MRALVDTKGHPVLVWVGLALVGLALVALPFALAGIGTAWVRITNLAILFVFTALARMAPESVGFGDILPLASPAMAGLSLLALWSLVSLSPARR